MSRYRRVAVNAFHVSAGTLSVTPPRFAVSLILTTISADATSTHWPPPPPE